MSIEALLSRLAALESSYHPPTSLVFNVRLTVDEPILSSSSTNSDLLDYRVGLTILNVEADILSKRDPPLGSLLHLANLWADITNRLWHVQLHIRNIYSKFSSVTCSFFYLFHFWADFCLTSLYR